MIQLIDFLKSNWAYILLVVVAIIYFLSALATYRIDLAKLTPDKTDDEKAKLFKGRVQATVKFLKSLFRIGKKPDNKGFVNPMFLVGLVCGALIVGAVFKLISKPNEPQIVEKEKIVYVEVEKKQEATKKVTHVKTKADGSTETKIVEQSDTQSESFLAGRVEREDKKLGIYLGAGLQSDKLDKPFASLIITYDPYALSAQSDFRLDHRVSGHLGFRF